MRDGYATTNGIRMYYVEEGHGPRVLLCHGCPETWYSYRHQLGPLAEAGCAVGESAPSGRQFQASSEPAK